MGGSFFDKPLWSASYQATKFTVTIPQTLNGFNVGNWYFINFYWVRGSGN